MKTRRYILILIGLGSLLSCCSWQKIHSPLNIMSFNIRYDNPGDSLNAWINRKELAVETILNNNIDIVGMQEVLLSQQKYLEEKLSGYDFYAVGRNDGNTSGEMGSIFFRKERFQALERSTFWLSETPDIVGSKGWNAVLPRIVSWVKFKDTENDNDFFFFNTHFSHVSEEARTNSAKLLIRKVAEIAKGYPVIITGDFNCTNDSEPYAAIINPENTLQLFDTHYISETEHFGGLQSVNGFGRSQRDVIIDYIFCDSSFKVNSHGILAVKKDSVFISDHFPIIAELILKK